MSKLVERVDSLIHKLDGAAGRLIVASMSDPVVREAKEMVTAVSIELGEIIDSGCIDDA